MPLQRTEVANLFCQWFCSPLAANLYMLVSNIIGYQNNHRKYGSKKAELRNSWQTSSSLTKHSCGEPQNVNNRWLRLSSNTLLHAFGVVLFLRFFQLQFCFNESCCLVISIIMDDNISAAIRAVHGGLSANEATKTFGIPRTTFRRRLVNPFAQKSGG